MFECGLLHLDCRMQPLETLLTCGIFKLIALCLQWFVFQFPPSLFLLVCCLHLGIWWTWLVCCGRLAICWIAVGVLLTLGDCIGLGGVVLFLFLPIQCQGGSLTVASLGSDLIEGIGPPAPFCSPDCSQCWFNLSINLSLAWPSYVPSLCFFSVRLYSWWIMVCNPVGLLSNFPRSLQVFPLDILGCIAASTVLLCLFVVMNADSLRPKVKTVSRRPFSDHWSPWVGRPCTGMLPGCCSAHHWSTVVSRPWSTPVSPAWKWKRNWSNTWLSRNVGLDMNGRKSDSIINEWHLRYIWTWEGLGSNFLIGQLFPLPHHRPHVALNGALVSAYL